MLYKETLNNWLTEKKIYLKYSTYTNYYNIIANHILPNLGEYDISILDNDILQQFILDQLDHGRTDGKGGISIKYAKDADLVILIIDGSKDLTNEDIEILGIVNPKKTIIILNKIDLEQKIDENTQEISRFENIIKISALKKEGINDLYEKISNLFNLNQINVDNDIVIINERHILGIGIGFTLMDIILLIYKRKDKKEN